MLRDQEPFLYVCSLSWTDFVGERREDFAGDLVGDFVGDLRGEEGVEDENDVLFSLVSGSVFFLGDDEDEDEDLVKRPISIQC